MHHRLVIDPFDGVTVRDAAGDQLPISSTKARALLGYLSFRPDLLDTRERIVGLLWSESGEEKARVALRQCLRQLKMSLGKENDACLSLGRQHVGLTSGLAASRALLIEERVRNGDVDPFLLAAEGLPERLFYGFESLDPSLTSWIHVVRQSWRLKIVAALERLMDAPPDASAQLKAAEALTALDASHEPAHRVLIEAHALAGNTSAALRQYEVLWRELDERHDCEPQEETTRLIAAIKMGEQLPGRVIVPAGKGDAGAGVVHTTPVIGVGPVHGYDAPSSADRLGHGFRSEMLAALARFREWRVVEAADGRPPSPVDYRVETTHSDYADESRFVVTLKDAQTSQIIWSETYTAEHETFGRSMRHIVRRIALALNIYISAERIALPLQMERTDWDTFSLWLYGQSLSFKWRPEAREEARAVFQRIIRSAPTFVPAYSSLVMLENTYHLAFPGVLRSEQRQREALELAQEAVAMDPLDTKTHLAAAWSMAMNGRFSLAQQFFLQSYDLNPNDPWTIVSSALGLAFSGSLSDGMQLAREALQLEQHPSPSHCEYQANISFVAGDYEASHRWGQMAAGVTQDSTGWQVASLAHLGRVDEARRLARSFVAETLANWHGAPDPDERSVVRWFLQCFPLAHPDVRERLRDGLALAGLPAGEGQDPKHAIKTA